MPQKLEVATGNVELRGVIIEVDEDSGRARAIERIRVPA
jgi:calcineurin-like phosphoesterase